MGWGDLYQVFIQVCGVAAWKRTPVQCFSLLSEKKAGSLTTPRWIFPNKRLNGGFVVKKYLNSAHANVVIPLYVSNESADGISDYRRNSNLELSFNLQEPFELSG